MKKLPVLLSCLLLTGCMNSMTMVHTQGEASDVVDETSTPTSTVKPTVTIPVKPI